VILPRSVRDDVIAHARDTAPAECCGVLIGTDAAIVAAVRAANLADSPSRFLIDPQDHIRARRDARARGLDVIGFYHSHPRSDALPSATDLAEASYENHLYLIVGLRGEAADVRIYRFTGTSFALEVADTGADFDHHRR
jgi:proteasome lid subunit RPN8/RPN11